jgi:DNA polymerase-3 subunit gamma/tau
VQRAARRVLHRRHARRRIRDAARRRAMSYLVLARKYRPRTFADMVGQETVTQVLKGAIQEGRIGHAYLFCGPRGTGKTTTARILAKALNCERGPTIDPCLQCERCLGIEDGSEVDVVEIDAASHTSVDNVRDLKEQVAYAPMRARFKVWIIDEVHMLSKSAFNAFLKTLEEPPPHVKFLFATTDPQKVLETVLSRVQVLKLSPISEGTIAARLSVVFEREGIRPEAGVVEELARRARGGMRDALSLADQLLSLVGARPTLADAKALSVDAGGELADALLEAIIAKDRAAVLGALPAAEGGEADIIGALVDALRQQLVLALCGVDAPQVQLDAARRAQALERARRFGLERAQLALEELLLARERVARLPIHGRAILESALLDLARGDGLVPLNQIVERLSALEARLASGAPRATSNGAATSASTTPDANTSAGSSHAPTAAHKSAAPAYAPLASHPPEPAASAPSASAPAPTPAPATQSAPASGIFVPPRPPANGPRAAASTPAVASMPAAIQPPIAVVGGAPTGVASGGAVAAVRPSTPLVGIATPGATQGATQGATRGTATATAPRTPVQPAAPQAAPAAELARPIRGAVSGVLDAWTRFLEALSGSHPEVHAVLKERGRLADLDARRAVVSFANLREHERALVVGPEVRAACRAALSRVLGREVELHLQDAAALKGRVDEYTTRVAARFDGRIED